MTNKEKITLYVKTVIKAVWLIISLLIWGVMFTVFLDNVKTAAFGMWMAWGFACTLVMIPTAIVFIWGSAKEGYREGMHSFKGNLFSSVYGGIGISIRDRRYSQAIITMVMAVIVFLLVGPILLPIKAVFTVIEIVAVILRLKDDKVFLFKALKITGIVAAALLVVVTVISVISAFSSLKYNYKIVSSETENGYELEVCRKVLGTSLDAEKYVWEVSDPNVAEISSDGLLCFKKGGYVAVRAVSSEDSSDYVETSFFTPYDVVYSSGLAKVTEMNDFDADEFWMSLAEQTVSDAYDIVCATRADDIEDVLEGLFGFFITFNDDDAYMFSSAIGLYHVENEELYVLHDWTNDDFTYSNVTEAQLTSVMCAPYNADGLENGSSINNDGVNTINAYLHKEGPADRIYRLSQMDDKYEYRVVVRGDFNYGVSSHYYRHGLVSSLVELIADLATMDLEGIEEGKWTETRRYCEVSDVENLNIYIEYREKQ